MEPPPDLGDLFATMRPQEVLEMFVNLGREIFPQNQPYSASDDTLTTCYQALVRGSECYRETPQEEHRQALLNLLNRTEFQAAWKVLRDNSLSEETIKIMKPQLRVEMYRAALYTAEPKPAFFNAREEGINALVKEGILPADHPYGRLPRPDSNSTN